MNTQEVQRCLGYLCAAFPNAPMTDATAAIWLEHLVGYEAEDGMVAVRRIIAESTFFPSIAEFVTQATAARTNRRRREAPWDGFDVALPAGPQTSSERAQIAKLAGMCRDVVQRSKALGTHDHHGPKPCPVCGGVRKSARDRVQT